MSGCKRITPANPLRQGVRGQVANVRCPLFLAPIFFLDNRYERRDYLHHRSVRREVQQGFGGRWPQPTQDIGELLLDGFTEASDEDSCVEVVFDVSCDLELLVTAQLREARSDW